uniref:Sugar fermentation stimulation protein C-terminal domain-containing protein n=1 Tax=Grammatophora oceanica TaxID=210454 RepID=A0A7S1Y8M7_9STRA|mmetsp:Transcript_31814/g.47284  ORF Transcript_31814/g.47284 Transcript_31814/m.47284 type:complete len:404 (+) Transcript_31814:373-1584(+)
MRTTWVLRLSLAFTSAVRSSAMVKTRSGKRSLPSSAPDPKRAVSSVAASSRTEAETSVARDATSTKSVVETTSAGNGRQNLLLELDTGCVRATFGCRPSKRNRSPYVADIYVPSLGREAICHVPNLDMGGKMREGVEMLVRPQRDKKGNLLGPNAVSPKYGTPKCEFVAQLLLVDESNLSAKYVPTWVGAHPSLGEKLVEKMLNKRLLNDALPIKPTQFQSQVTLKLKNGSTMKPDFVLEQHGTKRKRLLEIKTVVDTDYCAQWPLPERTKCVFTSSDANYSRTAIFPWGQSNQKGPDGEKVVSARAIKHVRELTKLLGEYDATVLFVVIRNDAAQFRPNFEACPSFAKYLREAADAGVQILVKRVRWEVLARGGDEDSVVGASCYNSDWLDIIWPTTDDRQG